MSDPVANADIEDVLSSIRRLVSEGEQSRVRDTAPSPAEPEPEDATESKPEKLVLTPAHMVASGGAPANSDPQSDDAGPLKLTQIVWEDEQTEQSAEPADEPKPEHGDAAETDEEAPAEDSLAASEPGSEPVADTEMRHSRSDLEAAIAELEASVGGDFEPDGSEDASPVEAMIWPGSRRMEPATDAELSDLQQDWHAEEPAATDEDAPQSEAAEAETPSQDDEIEEFLANAGMVDEEMLRQLVAEIVREELQGTLGERITRNVRKLVRREIYRILSSQDFD